MRPLETSQHNDIRRQFDVKLGAVMLLRVTMRYIHRLQHAIGTGGVAVMARTETFGKFAPVLATIALLCAVLTRD